LWILWRSKIISTLRIIIFRLANIVALVNCCKKLRLLLLCVSVNYFEREAVTHCMICATCVLRLVWSLHVCEAREKHIEQITTARLCSRDWFIVVLSVKYQFRWYLQEGGPGKIHWPNSTSGFFPI